MINDGYKKDPLTAVATTYATPKWIRVVAPTNLPGGYQIEVQTDNEPPIPFTANVPSEGVKAGDVFLTPPPPGYEPPLPQINAPTGRWKDGLCDFFANGCCHPQAWLAICCTEIAMGQIMHRFRLTWLGGLVPNHTPVTTFKTVLAIVVSYFIFDAALGIFLESNIEDGVQNNTPIVVAVSYIKDIVVLLFTVWTIYALYKTRKYVRLTYSIPETTCTGCEDCMCSTFCACCTVAQIGRHTGEYETYPGLCCNDTGLPSSAPMVV